MTAFTILLGGPVTPTKRLREQVQGTRAIAADSGMRHASLLGLVPELWIGDFDSSDADLQKAFADVPRETHPAEKEATDGDLAITAALRLGAQSLILVGGLGGQFDHLFCNAMMMMTLYKRDIMVWTSNGLEEVHPLQPSTFKNLALGTRISIVPLTPIAGLTVEGVKWPLRNKRIPVGSSLTIANEVSESEVALRLISGDGFIVVYPGQSA
jgi:thiamine pyrophosphokinase